MASWEGVTEFVAVAELSSFTAAAARLGTSVVQVSRKVSALEQRLDVKLLHRTTRNVRLTEAGQLYYDQCKQLVEGLEEAELAVTQMQQEPKGLLKVTAPVTFGEQHIAPLAHKFLQDYPQVSLDLNLTNRTLDLVENGIDVAIRLGRLKDSSLIAKRLGDRQLSVCASPTYLSEYGTPTSLEQLNQHQCLLGTLDYWRFREQGVERSLRLNGRIRCNSGLALLDACKAGLGLAQLPDYYVTEALAQGELQEVLTDYRDAREGIWAVYTPNRNLSAKARLFVDYLSQAFASP